ncbi:response regulator transcription factor [Gemmatimonadota bacterium]
MTKILIVEDDAAILRGLVDNLEHESYEVVTATDGEMGYQLIQREKPDLILLDLVLPRLSGYELCRKIREEGCTTPIVMLTARGEEQDRILGLDLGADDYITKPFSVREVMARIRAVMRRAAGQYRTCDSLEFRDITVDFRRFEAHQGNHPIKLTRKEFGVLRALVARAGEVVTRDELLDEIWGYDTFPTTRTVDNHIASLRSKLEEDPANPTYLLTVHGVGYRWAGKNPQENS